MQKRKILHYGLNRSGTNYLKEFLSRDFHLSFENREDARNHPLHKHFRLYEKKELIGRPNFKNELIIPTFKEFEKIVSDDIQVDIYVVISKDPYSWNLSYSRWGTKNNWESSPHPYILEYNEFYKKWYDFSLQSEKIMLIKYIDLLRSPEKIRTKFSNQFKIKARKDTASRDRIKKVPMSRRFSSSRLNYYLEEKYLDAYSQQELDELNQFIDHDLIEKLGYSSHF